MSQINVDIVSAEGEIFSGSASMVFAPAVEGDVGIAPRHAPLLTMLRAGEVRVRDEQGQDAHYFVSGGILEIQPFKVTVLADTALRAKDLDEAAALEAKRRAEDVLAQRQSDIDYARAQAELAEAIAKLQMLERLRKIRG
ncbi:F0F1 ATP synthase subunit epsilon [Candidatus Macondimonas diazotrophica]|jgi:F-type H+-transporting ATPase subunit epsilon|uniref:ATP synthase epsilon chain n=1 Tax=Candidatus Macondimonas diazotrophica TaxID=2305248 RepID=A0A4Z0F6Z2_9GAMM|nr:F0F1 ATP synthase subunit epsilon [Candidatus Macondimonas diazotrophica]MDY6955432.1 F0F1 ATP synthase subunit epsilon [Pseudomonadota bacterium]NCU01338.1 F0F1 ATP synthase subunit epsilon [Candidatus Macondimonas diazotrophica]TFZ82022.1 F0F1 ATP synthase subunit epsilon [Candidatus Macondimonas diazotrophica]HBG31396.1 F0F1 ATP synthase subunit epsilon [Gammaproteobacteria bacterium]